MARLESNLKFLQGGGEMGRLTREYNWENTDLGKPEHWPLSLQTTVGIILHSAFPMFLFWGKDLICFYNDAYRASLGNDGRHPLVGKHGKDVWLEVWDFINPLIEKVMAIGEPVWFEDQPLPIYRNGQLEDGFWTFCYSPAFGDSGEIAGVFVTCTETTTQVASAEKLQKNQNDLLDLFNQSPVALATIVRENLTFTSANEFYGTLVGRKTEDIIGKPLLEALPEIAGQGFDKLLNGVLDTGVAYVMDEVSVDLQRNGVLETLYVNLAYQPMRNDGANVTSILVVATDVTPQVRARKAIEENEAFLALTRDAVPAMIFYIDGEQRYRSYNSVFMEWFNVSAQEALGKTTREFIGEAAYNKAQPYLERAYDGQRVTYEMVAPSKMNKERWLNIVYTPHKDADGKVIGVIVLATDISESKRIELSLRESEQFSNNIFYNSPVAKIVYTGENMVIERVNEKMLDLLGRDESIIGKEFLTVIPELKDTTLLARMQHVFRTGEIYTMPEEQINLVRFGKPYKGYYTYVYKPLYSASGEIYGIMATASDITDQVLARLKVEAKEKEWSDLISFSPIGICVLSGDPVRVEEVNDRFLLIAGKTREQFMSTPYWEVMKEIAPIFQPILGKVFETGEKFTSIEHEMVLVRSGVKERIFATFEYIPVFDLEGKVSKVILMAIEVSHQVETRKQIEEAVALRTKELGETNLNLRRSNEELEQFAYIASHDLQEPIRKISTFLQMLQHTLDNPNEKSKDYINKIFNSTDRMTKLVRDVLAFSRVKGEQQEFEKVNLNALFNSVLTDFEVEIEKTRAKIEVANLPVIDGIPTQLVQLFSNLLSNSLKYKRADVSPVIKISVSMARDEKVAKRMVLDRNKKYHHIEFSDNGIGFDQEQAERIFKIFQRLHGKTEFEGTGIGLAICRRIVQNHQGHISAAAGENGGAVFNILLPDVHTGSESTSP